MYPFDCSLSADVKAEGRLDPFSRLSTKHATQPEYELWVFCHSAECF